MRVNKWFSFNWLAIYFFKTLEYLAHDLRILCSALSFSATHCCSAFGLCFDPPLWCPPVSHYLGLWMLVVVSNKRVLPWWFGEEADLVVWPCLEEVWGSVSPGNKHSLPCSVWETVEHTPRISMRKWCFLLARRVRILKHKAKPQSTTLQGGVSNIFSNVCLQMSSEAYFWKMKYKVQQYFTVEKEVNSVLPINRNNLFIM